MLCVSREVEVQDEMPSLSSGLGVAEREVMEMGEARVKR